MSLRGAILSGGTTPGRPMSDKSRREQIAQLIRDAVESAPAGACVIIHKLVVHIEAPKPAPQELPAQTKQAANE